jgi:hypothetical protein
MSPTGFKVIQFAGLTLGGGKGRKTSLCILEYYVKEKKLFLKELHENIEEKGRTSADTLIVKKLDKHKKILVSVGVDAPLKMPKCLRCRLVCPGHEKCTEPEILWMWKNHKKRHPDKRPNKIFTPYTERCVEQYINQEVSSEVYPGHAMGSNRAPLMARALYLKRRLNPIKLLEVYPRLSVWQLGQQLGVRKTLLNSYRHVSQGERARQQILDKWSEQGFSFIYHRDFKHMVKDVYAFESLISAYTAFLQYRGLCEPKPKDFPRTEAWITFPSLPKPT